MKRVRSPQAGLWGFYPLDKQSLLREIEKCFQDKRFGPGSIPKEKIHRYTVVGGIAPHAGYEYSGACAAHLYKEIGENVDHVDTVIVIGTNHTGYGGAITTCRTFIWTTPLGTIDIDEEFINELLREYPTIEENELAHYREHSVEVQLPFLQYTIKEFRLVPIVVKEIDYRMASECAKALVDVATKLHRAVLLIASSDFTHHGEYYGYVLYTENVSKNVRDLDMQFIDKILKLDTSGFLNLVKKFNSTICGIGAIAITMEYAKIVNAKTKLLMYYNSGELTHDESMVVGYASILFYK